MKFRHWISVGVLLPLVACGRSDAPIGAPVPPISPSLDIRLEEVTAAAGLDSPMDLQAPPADPRLFIAERPGRIRIVKSGTKLTAPFLDISSRVYTGGEAGLLSFAFDPDFGTNGFVYVHFVENIPNTFGDIVVERYQVSSGDPDVLQTQGTEVIRILHRDANNHYGGRVAFGTDGMLYLSTGDGGGANNQFGHAQDADSHLGKLLRIDVSVLPYAIPPDNPVWPAVGRNENWAIGLRNPFRYAFDSGRLYIADVGQGAREEVDAVDAPSAGLNYGWSIMEGNLCLGIGGSCATPGLTPPAYDYDHGQGCAIIGGYVYRGQALPQLQGQYLFSDLCSGFLRGLTLDAFGAASVAQSQVSPGSLHSFGRDGAGELYILTADSRVLRIVPG
jgi:glucose/arabinose dehydrogenase